jgi:autotransporter-associated beta strand protein
LGNSSTATAQALASLTVGSGNSTVNVTNAGAVASLTFGGNAGLVIAPDATLNFTTGTSQILGSANNQILFLNPPTLTNGILKGATTTDGNVFTANPSGYNLASYGTTGITALGGGLGGVGAYTTLPTSGATGTTNYIATATTALTAPESVNALLVLGNDTISGATSSTLTLTSGTLAIDGNNAVVSVPLALGSTQGVFLTAANSNAAQTLTFGGTPTGGTFTLGFGGSTTPAIGFSSQGVAIGKATESSSTVTITTSAVDSLAVGETVVIAGITPTGYNGTYTVATTPTTTSFTYTDSNTGLAASTVAGTETVSAATEALNIQTALGALSTVGSANNVAVGGNSSTVYTVTFVGALAGTAQSLLVATPSLTPSGTLTAATTLTGGLSTSATITSSITGTDGVAIAGSGSLSLGGVNSGLTGINAVQTINFVGTPTGGSFSLSFDGTTTMPIAYSTSPTTLQSNVQAALAALPTIGSTANFTLGGTATSLTVTFTGAMAGSGQNVITVAVNALTGGTTPGLAVANSTTVTSTAVTETNDLATFTAANTFVAGEIVNIAGESVAGYNGSYVIASATSTSFTYYNPTWGLGAATTGTATALVVGFDTTLNSGTLSASEPAFLPAGGVMLSGGTFQAAGTVTNEVALNGNNVAAVTLGGAAALTLAGPVVLGQVLTGQPAGSAYLADGNNEQLAVGSAGVVVSGIVVGEGNLDVNNSGSGVLTFSGANNFADVTNIVNGIVNLQSTSVPASTSGAASTASADEISTALTEAGNLVTFTAANTFLVGETVTITNAVPAGYNGTFVVTSETGALFTYIDPTGVLANATTQGWANPAPFVGTGALGPAGGGVVVANGGTLQIANPVGSAGITLAKPIALVGAGDAGAGATGALENVQGANTLGYTGGTTNFDTDLASPATISVDTGSLSQANTGGTNAQTGSDYLDGPGDLTKVGGGTLVLDSGNYQTGQVNINNGVVQIATNEFALGPQVGNAVVNSGASLEFAAGTFDNKTIVLNGSGYTAPGSAVGTNPDLAGALINIGSATLQSNIILASNASIGGISGDNWTLTGNISGPGDLNKVGANTISLQGSETYTGNTYVEQGPLWLQTYSTDLNTASIGVDTGASFYVDNSVVNNPNRLSSTVPVPVTLQGGTFFFYGYAGVGIAPTATSQAIGPLTLGPGNSTVEAGYNAAPVTGCTSVVTFASLIRQTGGEANFLPTNSTLDTTADRIAFGAAPATVGSNGGILPYAMLNNADFATYDSVGQSITNFTGYVTSLAAAGPNDIVKLGANEALTGSKTIAGLLLPTANELVELNGYTLTIGGVSSGAVVATASGATIIGGTLNFGGTDGVIMPMSNDTLTVNAPITGQGGLSVAGAGTLVLDNASPNLSGPVTLAGATLSLGSAGALGTGTVQLKSGTLQALGALTLSNSFMVDNSNVAIGGSNDITFAGTFTLNSTLSSQGLFAPTVVISDSAPVTFAGNITGSSAWFLSTPSSLPSSMGASTTDDIIFTSANTYTGTTYVIGNLTLVADNNNAFGTGTLAIATGTLLAGGNNSNNNNTITLPNNLLLNGQGVILGSSSYNGLASGSTLNSNLIFSGSVALAVPVIGADTATLAEVYNTVTFQGNVSGAGGLLVAGPGNLVLNGANSYYGGTVLNSSGTGAVSSLFATSATNIASGVNFNALNPETTRIDPSINYNTTLAPYATQGFSGTGAFGQPPVNPAGFATSLNGLIVTGYVNIVNPGNYSFECNSDDGGVMFVDGILASNNDEGSNEQVAGPAIPLTAGLHEIQVRVNNNTGNMGAMVYYNGPDTINVNTIIPFGFLSNDLGTAGTLTVGNSSALGNGLVSLSNGVLNAANAVTLNNAVSFTGGALPLAITGSKVTLAQSAALAGNVSLSLNNTTLQLNNDLVGTAGLASSTGVLAGPTGLTMTNQPVVAGTTTYTGANGILALTEPVSYSGPTTVAAGTLDLATGGTLSHTAAAGQIQTISITKAADGNFFLTAGNVPTAAIAYSTSWTTTASNIQAALVALSGNYANVTVTALPTCTVNNQYFAVTFPSGLAQQPVLTINTSGLGVSVAGQMCLGTVSTTTNSNAGVTLDAGGTLTLDDSTVDLANRLNSAATVSLAGGTLNLTGNSIYSASQSAAALTVASGNSTVNVTNNGQSTTLTFASLTRNAGAATPARR